ncbi:MAG: YidC/Oxa1 family rane protein insertase [Solirubrobacteraceae bacterium]|nr:YidC/Oxa1 family rane protein insertase [Solirubrobacteraceae bacterium]
MLPLANVLQPLIDVFESVLLFFHDNVGFGWGFSIIALTIVVRAALVPLTLKQFKSMQAMQRLAPDIKALQAKFKDDKQRLQQETMKFYQENKVNPFASCLPLVLQMPVFISLFYMLRKDLRHDICPAINPPSVPNPKPCGASDASQFLFIPDITDKATGGVLIVLLVLYVGSQLVSGIFMSTTTDRNQRMIMLGLPFLFVPFIQSFPAGLLVYWITTNLWTVGQGYVVRRTAGPMVPVKASGDAPAGALAATAAPERKRPSREPKEDGAASAAAAPARDRDRAAAPPPPPRRKKKRSGRRR